MRLQLDTIDKTIKLESKIKLSELVENLEKLLPNGLWKEFTLETNVTINNWNSPFYIKEYIKPIYPSYPSYPWITCGENTLQLNSGTYNVEC